MADINSPVEIGVTTGPIRGSRKVHVAAHSGSGIRVAMREIHLEPSSGEPPVRVYDTSGPYTDPDARIDIMADLSRKHAITVTFSPLFDSNSAPDLVDIAHERVRHLRGQALLELFLRGLVPLDKLAVFVVDIGVRNLDVQPLRFLAGLDRILIIHKSSDIKSFPLESDGSTVFSIPQLIDATESAGIITAVLSFFQHLHTGSIYHMQLPGKLLPYLLSQTATASVITMKKAILCHIHFISAVTPTMPEHRALFAPFICMIESSQPPETLSADVGDPASPDIMAAAAAGTFSGFQAVCSGNMHIPAVTATFPPGPAVFTFQ